VLEFGSSLREARDDAQWAQARGWDRLRRYTRSRRDTLRLPRCSGSAVIPEAQARLTESHTTSAEEGNWPTAAFNSIR